MKSAILLELKFGASQSKCSILLICTRYLKIYKFKCKIRKVRKVSILTLPLPDFTFKFEVIYNNLKIVTKAVYFDYSTIAIISK